MSLSSMSRTYCEMQPLALVFVETKRGADDLQHWMSRNGFPAMSTHGDIVQMVKFDCFNPSASCSFAVIQSESISLSMALNRLYSFSISIIQIVSISLLMVMNRLLYDYVITLVIRLKMTLVIRSKCFLCFVDDIVEVNDSYYFFCCGFN